MIENILWLVNFTSNQNRSGSGVISFKNGCVFGGDSSYYYFGKYEQNGNEIKVIVNIKQHSQGESIFGSIPKFEGFVMENPSMKINASLKKLKDLSTHCLV
jgi:hypothetical protein